MFLLTLLSIACCCGVPAYYLKPMWEQYPAKAELPAKVADLSLLDDPASVRTSQRLAREAGFDHWVAEDTFAGVYGDARGKRVTVFGVTGFRWSPDTDVTSELDRLRKKYQITGEQAIPTETRGEFASCGTGRADGADVVVCTWADHGSLATALFTRRSVEDSSALLARLRADIVIRDRAKA